MNIQKTVREEVAKRLALRERLERDEALTPEEWVVAKEHDWMEVGIKYREERNRRGLSLAEVARQTGISASTLRRFELGMPIQRAKAISLSYGLLFRLLASQELATSLHNAQLAAAGIGMQARFVNSGLFNAAVVYYSGDAEESDFEDIDLDDEEFDEIDDYEDEEEAVGGNACNVVSFAEARAARR
jgi:transcriptional regulator with XRE-family HTH domain